MYEYKALITNVVDGDTIDAVIDVGFLMTTKQRLRLLGINAPEKFGPTSEAGMISKNYVVSRLLNKDVIIHTEKDDAFGRWLATIYLDGVNINEELVSQGYAVVDIR